MAKNSPCCLFHWLRGVVRNKVLIETIYHYCQKPKQYERCLLLYFSYVDESISLTALMQIDIVVATAKILKEYAEASMS